MGQEHLLTNHQEDMLTAVDLLIHLTFLDS